MTLLLWRPAIGPLPWALPWAFSAFGEWEQLSASCSRKGRQCSGWHLLFLAKTITPPHLSPVCPWGPACHLRLDHFSSLWKEYRGRASLELPLDFGVPPTLWPLSLSCTVQPVGYNFMLDSNLPSWLSWAEFSFCLLTNCISVGDLIARYPVLVLLSSCYHCYKRPWETGEGREAIVCWMLQSLSQA